MEVKYHRFVLAEMNTHRAFSRNTASSRAIPYQKMRANVLSDPALPLEWPNERKGMQGGESLHHAEIGACIDQWFDALNQTVQITDKLHELGLHKSVINRLLEPFQYVTSIITATDWKGFWDQRDSELAQPEIREAARAMRKAYDLGSPQRIGRGEWHLPYITNDDLEEANNKALPKLQSYELFKQISAARCARVSYLTHDGKRDWSADLSLFSRLATAYPPHWSPMEHVATPNIHVTQGNFNGWSQLRHDMESRGFGKDVKNLL